MWEFIFIFFWRILKEGICDKKNKQTRKRWNMWCLKSLCRLYKYIFKKHSSRWGALGSSERCSSRKPTALIPKEEILNNANFLISIWDFDNSVYLQKKLECITTILIIIFSTQTYTIIFDIAYAGHKFQKAISWATSIHLKTLLIEPTCFNKKRGIIYISIKKWWILVLMNKDFFSTQQRHW